MTSSWRMVHGLCCLAFVRFWAIVSIWWLHCHSRSLKIGPGSVNDHHDDVIKWKHFPPYWPFVRGIHRSPLNYPHKGQWRGCFLWSAQRPVTRMFSLICVWINGWVNNHEAGDLRRYRAHYDVIVMHEYMYVFAYNDKTIKQNKSVCLFFGV